MDLSFKVRPLGRKAACARPAIMLLLICILILPVLCLYPFYSDIDIHHCIAIELMRSSELPYRASFVSNLPGIVGIHLLAIALFGTSVFAFRVMETFLQAIIVLVLYRVSCLWLSEVPAIVSCIVYALLYVHGPMSYVGHPDCFAVLPMLVGIGTLIVSFRCKNASRRTMLLLAAGMAYGLAACFRPTFALMLFAPMIFLFDPRAAIGRRNCLLLMIGFMVAITLCVAIYAPTVEGVREIYFAIIRYNVEVYGHAFDWRDYTKRSFVIVAMLVWWRILVWRHKQKGLQFLNAPNDAKEIYFLIATFISILIGIAVMGRLAGYHLTPFFALFVPVITTSVWEWSLEDRRRRVLSQLLLIGAVVVLYPWQLLGSLYPGRPGNRFPKELYCDSITSHVVLYTLQHTKPTDAVEVASFFPTVRWRINRPVATRFNIPQCLTLKKPNGTFAGYQREWQSEYVSCIEQIRPKYYILQYLVDRSGAYTTLDLMFSIPGLRTLLDRSYRLDTTISGYMFYERRELEN
jgi:hypothetical protein